MEREDRREEERLKGLLRNLEEKREDFLRRKQKIQKEEEEEYDQLREEYLILDRMLEDCRTEDHLLYQQIEESQSILQGMKRKKEEFREDFKEMERKFHIEIDGREEEIQDALGKERERRET